MFDFLDRFRPEWAKPSDQRIVEVGWLLDPVKSSVIWTEPRPVSRNLGASPHAKSANHCLAVRDIEARLFGVPCPVDLHLRFAPNKEGVPNIVNVAGERSSIRSNYISKMVKLVSPREWRQPEHPLIQVATPYLFLADEPVYMEQVPAFLHYRSTPLPGTQFCGRFPIHIWPRPLMWAFEWLDPARDIILTRGEPWFYVRFEAVDPSRRVRLLETEKTPERPRSAFVGAYAKGRTLRHQNAIMAYAYSAA